MGGNLTVKEVLESKMFANFTIISGKTGIENIADHMIVLETPDGIKWLEGNEIVLTAGHAFVNSKSFKQNLIKDAKDNGVAAIGIKTGRFFGEITNELIEESDKAGIPIFVLGKNTIYTDLTSSFYELLFNKKAENLIYENESYNRLLNFQTNKSSINDIVEETSKLTDLEIKYIRYIDRNNSDEYKSMHFPINTDSNFGYLSIDAKENLSKFQIDCIKYSISLIKNKISLEQEAIFSKSKNYHMISQILMSGADVNEDFCSIIRENLGWRSSSYYGIYFKNINISKVANSELRKYIEYKSKNQFLYNLDDEGMIVYLPYNRKYIEEILNGINQVYNSDGNNVLIRISSLKKDFSEINSAYKEAKNISFYYNEVIVFLEDKKEEVAFLKIKDIPEINNYLKSIIANIINSNEELYITLDAFISNNLIRQKTAKTLHIHLETLRYRLNKIKDLTGLDVYKSDDLAILTIAVRMHKYI